MEPEKVVVEPLHDDVELPEPATAAAAGLDAKAYLNGRTVKVFRAAGRVRVEEVQVTEGLQLHPGDRALIPLGFKAQLPEGWEAQVRTRSGLALKHGLVVANSPGTIDADYPGEWMVILHNAGTQPTVVNHGDRVAQIVLAVLSPDIPWEHGTVGQTSDREGGFGSTGR